MLPPGSVLDLLQLNADSRQRTAMDDDGEECD